MKPQDAYDLADMNLLNLVREALLTDGAHHKQWYLEQIGALIGLDVEVLEHAPGIPD